MPTLHVDNVPDQLYQRIEQLAVAEQIPLAEEALRLLQEAVARQPMTAGPSPGDGRSQREILDDIIRNRFTPIPGMPSVVEMLREDRER